MAFINRITAWSYSRFGLYSKCPFAAKCSIIDRIKEPSNDAMERGTAVHKMAEVYTTGKEVGVPVPKELGRFEAKFKGLRKAVKKFSELEWAFDIHWQPTSWFAENAWLRIKVDSLVINEKKKLVQIVDYKTGREHPEHADQRSLYALGSLLTHPGMDVEAAHWYLDSGAEKGDKFAADLLPVLQADWMVKVTPMLTDMRFAPRPGPYCRWCFFSHAKNGPCKY